MKGNIAKEKIIKRIQSSFGDDFIGVFDGGKKIYVWEDDGGEKVQIAITMTCPKNQVEAAPKYANGGLDFSSDEAPEAVNITAAPAEITAEEREIVTRLMDSLGI